jgi:hypothetical protein
VGPFAVRNGGSGAAGRSGAVVAAASSPADDSPSAFVATARAGNRHFEC